MKADLTQEQIKEILDNAPEGAIYYKPKCMAYSEGYVDSHNMFSYGGDDPFEQVAWVSGRLGLMIKISDLRAQLEPEWKNGLPPVGSFVKIDNYDGKDIVYGHEEMGSEVEVVSVIESEGVAVVRLSLGLGVFDRSFFRKPETPEQKAAREREEAAIHIHDVANEAFFSEKTMDMPDEAGWEFADEDVRRMWLAVVDLTGYRKESN